MNGAENIKDVARTVRPPSTQRNSLSSSDAPQIEQHTVDPGGNGVLAAADRALNHSLGNSGFVDISSPFAQSFAACLDYHPVSGDIGDLKPGTLKEIMASVKSQMTNEARQSEQAQARVPPEAAVRLLA